MKKIFYWAWSIRLQFKRYFIIGLSGVLLDLSTLYFLKEYLYLHQVLAISINQCLILSYIFVANRAWSFSSNDNATPQLLKFLLVICFNYLFAIFIMWIFSEQLLFNYLLVRIFNVIFMVPVNFLLYKYFVYKKLPVNKCNNVF